MIAIAKIGGHQEIVQVGEILQVDKLAVEEGKTLTFETLLLSKEDASDFQIGTPILKDVLVEAKVLDHGRGDKIRVYKMSPRKRYRRTQGHRQDYTTIEITKIGGAAKKVTPKKAEKVEAPKAEAKKAPAKKAA